jgi:DoxX-like family
MGQNRAPWIVASLLAVELLFSSTKIIVPKEKLAATGGAATKWVQDFSQGARRVIRVLEFPGAVGLILPAALGIAPVLVPLAAMGAVLLFVGAVIMRLRRGERATILIDLVNLAVAAFVALAASVPGDADTRPVSIRLIFDAEHSRTEAT